MKTICFIGNFDYAWFVSVFVKQYSDMQQRFNKIIDVLIYTNLSGKISSMKLSMETVVCFSCIASDLNRLSIRSSAPLSPAE